MLSFTTSLRFLTVFVITATSLAGSAICAEPVPKVQDVCEGLGNADKLHGKVVTLKGDLIVDPEAIAIYGQRCKQVKIAGAKWGAAVTLRFLGPRQPPAVDQTLIDPKSIDRFGDRLRDTFELGIRGGEIVVVGILRSRDEKLFNTDSKGRRRRMGFGHLNAFPAEILVVNVRSLGEIRKFEPK